MDDSEAFKEGFSVYHGGRVPNVPKYPATQGVIEVGSKPQKAELSETWHIAPIPQKAYISKPPPPEITHYSLHYSRVQQFFH